MLLLSQIDLDKSIYLFLYLYILLPTKISAEPWFVFMPALPTRGTRHKTRIKHMDDDIHNQHKNKGNKIKNKVDNIHK